MTQPTTSPTAERLDPEWIEEMMFDHIAVCAAEPDKWKRIKLFTDLGHRFKATLTPVDARTPTGQAPVVGDDHEALNRVFAKWNCDRNSEPQDLIKAILAAGFRRATPEDKTEAAGERGIEAVARELCCMGVCIADAQNSKFGPCCAVKRHGFVAGRILEAIRSPKPGREG